MEDIRKAKTGASQHGADIVQSLSRLAFHAFGQRPILAETHLSGEVEDLADPNAA